MTDNIFEIETIVLAHYACTECDSGILLTDFACGYHSVNHTWIFNVLEKADLLVFILQFLRMISSNSVTDVEFATKTRGQFVMDRGVRQGCLASGFLYVMAFDPFFRWIHDSVILKDPTLPDFLQPVPCAHADDFAVAALSLRALMLALFPAFETMDSVAGLNLNHRKCCWVQYGSDSCQDLLDWVSARCEEFRENENRQTRHVCGYYDWPRRPLASLDCATDTQR